MRYAVISDIHSNEEAATAVFADIKNSGVDEIICLGDIVGYGASPKVCLDMVREKCSVVIAGNHDHAVIGLTNKEYFNISAKKAVEWTAKKLDKTDLDYMSSLPLLTIKETMYLAHASLHKPGEWGYILDEYDADSSFCKMGDVPIAFIGHSHIPMAFEANKFIQCIGSYSQIKLNTNFHYIINVGSVGQPRDGIWQSAYALYDSDKKEVELRRISYDVKSAQKKILDQGLPEFLAERIEYGR
jgi:predicted phosphodiesterase